MPQVRSDTPTQWVATIMTVCYSPQRQHPSSHLCESGDVVVHSYHNGCGFTLCDSTMCTKSANVMSWSQQCPDCAVVIAVDNLSISFKKYLKVRPYLFELLYQLNIKNNEHITGKESLTITIKMHTLNNGDCLCLSLSSYECIL